MDVNKLFRNRKDVEFTRRTCGDFAEAMAGTLAAESLTFVLYPDDSTSQGQALRFLQEYFLVACSLADIVRRFRRTNDNWGQFADKVAIQLNDTHPAMAVPELLRILLDEAHLGWDEAWNRTQKALAYTNHTLLPKALDMIFSDYFSRYEPSLFEPLRETLLTSDHYMHLADFRSYLDADRQLVDLYAKPDECAHKAILNIASSGRFSSDRTIAQYASEIWTAKPCPVS